MRAMKVSLVALLLMALAPLAAVSYTHLTLPTTCRVCSSRGGPGE